MFAFSDGTDQTATTTIDYSTVTANGVVMTLSPTDSHPDTASYSTASKGFETSVTNHTTTTGTRTGTATGTQSLVASFTNAAPAADVKFRLGFLGFAGVVAAVGL
jgi:hypothetical protein